jgi:hypothetical protein
VKSQNALSIAKDIAKELFIKNAEKKLNKWIFNLMISTTKDFLK